MTKLEIRENRKTSAYPTRYAAFDNPGILFEQELSPTSRSYMPGGYEFAVFYQPAHNAEYPHLTDGVYCAIVGYQNKGYLLECCVTRPDEGRRQAGKSERFDKYEDAIAALIRWVHEDAQAFLDQPNPTCDVCGAEYHDKIRHNATNAHKLAAQRNRWNNNPAAFGNLLVEEFLD